MVLRRGLGAFWVVVVVWGGRGKEANIDRKISITLEHTHTILHIHKVRLPKLKEYNISAFSLHGEYVVPSGW